MLTHNEVDLIEQLARTPNRDVNVPTLKLRRLVEEVRDRRAADMTAEEAVCLGRMTNFVRGLLAIGALDREVYAIGAIAALDKLLAGQVKP